MKRLLRVINTVKYMTFRQWEYRLYYMLRSNLYKRRLVIAPENINLFPLPLNYKNNINNITSVNEANLIINNSIPTISGRVEVFNDKIDWDLKNENYRLICFRVNSFKYLLSLSDAYKKTKNIDYIKKGFELIDEWWYSNRNSVTGDKWNPYVIAERLVNWIGFCSEYAAIDGRELDLYANSIYQQAYELLHSIEYQLGANHLLSEGKALLISGVFLKDDRLYRYGKKILVDEYHTQFLKDGGHYERSVSYHIESLQQYFESMYVMKLINDVDYLGFVKMVKPAYLFLNSMIDVAGDIPLFNDAAIDYPFEGASEFLSTAECLYTTSGYLGKKGNYFNRWSWLPSKLEKTNWKSGGLFKDTGYFHYKIGTTNEEYSFFLDAGDGGPDSNLGHAHADALSILLKSSKKDIFVDGGVFTYESGIERNACRSTKLHNTIEIDDTDSAEIWSAFRVAKRGHTKINEFKINDNKVEISATHNGYCKCLKTPINHKRSIKIEDNNIIIEDYLYGKGRHNAVSRFHIGKDCVIKQLNEKEYIIDDILLSASEPIFVSDSEYAKEFGIKNQTKCIEISFEFYKEKTVSISLVLK